MVMVFFQPHPILQVKVDETVTVNQGVVCRRKTRGQRVKEICRCVFTIKVKGGEEREGTSEGEEQGTKLNWRFQMDQQIVGIEFERE